MSGAKRSARDFLAVSGSLWASVAGVAALTHLAFAPQARALLRVHFVAPAGGAGEALSIFAHNARIMASLCVLVVVVQVARGARGEGESPGRLERAVLRACDGVLVCYWSATAALAGVLLGAYGQRQLHAFLPHGPDELCAYALAIALYLEARRRRLALGHVVAMLGAAFAMLALAATAEVHTGAL